VVLFSLWQLLAQPRSAPAFVWENPDRAAFFFGEPVKIFNAIWVVVLRGRDLPAPVGHASRKRLLAFVIGSVLGLAVGLWLGLSPRPRRSWTRTSPR